MIKSAVLIPSAGIMIRTVEYLLPEYFPYARFLAIGIKKIKMDEICTQHYLD